MPKRARFAVSGYQDLQALPVRVRDAMLEQIEKWRSQEDAQAQKKS